jgi:cytochrome P450
MRVMREYFTPFCAERRRNPGTDMVSRLIAAGGPDDRLTEVEQVALCCMILLGGYVTSVCMMSLGVLLMLQHPETHARLRQEPQLWSSAVEEILRLESPVQRAIYLVAVEDIPLDGVTIPAGGKVALMLGAANRDPAAFPDPDRFDITRLPNRHLALSTGPHHCLGATLARMEARIAFPMLVARLPNLRLAPPAPKAPAWQQVLPGWLRPAVPASPAVVWLAHEHARGMRELHLAW